MQLRGLYAVADTGTIPPERFDASVRAAAAGGAVMIQYRDKSGAATERLRQATGLVRICREHGIVSIINDDVDLAALAAADGVHLGADDPDPRAARTRLGDRAIIGVSCYDDMERALAAAAAGADYVAFGRVFPSPTKPGGPRPGLDLLAAARRQTGLPVCAIGGITVERIDEIVAAGIDLAAVINDLFRSPDIHATARSYSDAFRRTAG